MVCATICFVIHGYPLNCSTEMKSTLKQIVCYLLLLIFVIIVGTTSKDLVIKASTLNKDTKYRLVSIVSGQGRKGHGESASDFFTNVPPYGGECKAYPPKGNDCKTITNYNVSKNYYLAFFVPIALYRKFDKCVLFDFMIYHIVRHCSSGNIFFLQGYIDI